MKITLLQDDSSLNEQNINPIQLKAYEWDCFCDSLIDLLKFHFTQLNISNSLQDVQNFLTYIEINNISTHNSFRYAIESNRNLFMNILIKYNMKGIYDLIFYGNEEGIWSYGQLTDINEFLINIKHSSLQYFDIQPEYLPILEDLLQFTNTILESTNNKNIIVTYTW